MIDQRDFDNVDILVDMYLKQHIPSGRYGQAQSQRQSPGQVLFNGYIFFAMNMNMKLCGIWNALNDPYAEDKEPLSEGESGGSEDQDAQDSRHHPHHPHHYSNHPGLRGEAQPTKYTLFRQ